MIGWLFAGEPPKDIRITSSRSSNADFGWGGTTGGGGRAGDAVIGWVGSPIPMNGLAAACTRNSQFTYLDVLRTSNNPRVNKPSMTGFLYFTDPCYLLTNVITFMDYTLNFNQ